MDSSILFKNDPEVLAKAAQRYERTEKSLKEDVLILKNWMTAQPHLPEVMDDHMLQNFLLLNKCSIEKTKQKIDMYYTLRSQIPEIYANINPKCPNIQQMMKIATWVVLPKLTSELYRIFVFKMMDKSLIDKLEPYDLVGLVLNIYEMRLNEDIMVGDIIIFDMDGLNFNYFTKLTPSVLAKMFAVYEKIFSIPMKGLYMVNAPSFVDMLLGLMKTIMKPKLFQRVVSSPDTSILKEHLPKEFIPKDYDGEAPSVEELAELIKPKFEQYQSRFDELDKLRADENLRPEELKNDEMLGFHGNFKKLDVD